MNCQDFFRQIQRLKLNEKSFRDLEEWLDEQIALNPPVERSDKRAFILSEQADQPSLFQILMKQARLELSAKEIEIADRKHTNLRLLRSSANWKIG